MCSFGTGVAVGKMTRGGHYLVFNDPQGRSSSAPAQGKRESSRVSVASPCSRPPHPQVSLPGRDSAACGLAGDTSHPQSRVPERTHSSLGCCQPLCLSSPGVSDLPPPSPARAPSSLSSSSSAQRCARTRRAQAGDAAGGGWGVPAAGVALGGRGRSWGGPGGSRGSRRLGEVLEGSGSWGS